MLKIILTALSNKEEALSLVDQLTQKIKVAVFKIKIAKQHLEVYNNQKEAYPHRLVALPLDKRFDPWAQELYNYFHDAGTNYVFPFNRQDNWEMITRKDKIFDGLYYHIKKYHYYPNGDITAEPVPCFDHPRLYKCHAIRHSRTDQLISYYKFDGFDLGALVGWSMGSSSKVSAAPAQASNYAEIRTAWKRYIWKLCIPSNYSTFNVKEETRREK
jgi:hypothetical protein